MVQHQVQDVFLEKSRVFKMVKIVFTYLYLMNT